MSITRYFDPRTAEELRIRHGIVRKSAIVRSLDYKKQYHDWKKAGSHREVMRAFQKAFEGSFFSETVCQWRNDQQLSRLVYELTGSAHTSATLFLLDLLKERCAQLDFAVAKAESWKELDPEQGVEVHQRYLFQPKCAWWKRMLMSRFIKGDLLVIEAIYIEQIRTRLEIRLYPHPKKPVYANVLALMTAVLKQPV